MRVFLRFSMWCMLLFIPAALFGGLPASLPLTGTFVDYAPISPLPERDGADEDSVLFFEGFENGIGEWTTVDLTAPGFMWHLSEENAFEGNSWWCSDEELGGYDNHWLQYLVSPVINLTEHQGEEITLTFKVLWAVEDPAVGQAPPDPFDAWDGCNLWISTDGGDDWEVFEPVTPEYTHDNLYAFGEEWHFEGETPGWCASSDGWVDAEFDLSDYGGMDNIMIRWAFCSDPGWATAEDADAIGFLVDNIVITSGQDVLLSNNGDEDPVPEEFSFAAGPTAGDYWEITGDDSHDGDFSANCPIQIDLQNALVSPPIVLPDEGWYIYFEFWVRADTRMSDSDADGYLDDLFRVEISDDGVSWTDMIYDYGRDETWWDVFRYYGPDTWFRENEPEWKRKLNITRYAGETIQLRWKAVTDNVMDNPQGSGIWIDDFRILMTQRNQYDAGVKWLHIPYPSSLDIEPECEMLVGNFGMVNLNRITKFYRIDQGRPNPVTPWDDLESDSLRLYTFDLDDADYSGMVDILAYTVVGNDENAANNSVLVEDVIIYPENVWKSGYDNRSYRLRYNIDPGSGPAVLFTPEDDGIDGAFDINALHVIWNGEQDVDDVSTTMRFYSDNDGIPGDDPLYEDQITVTRTDVLPNMMVIDLTDVAELKELETDYWVWFEIERDDFWPQIVGDNLSLEMGWGIGHYFHFDGENLEALDEEHYQIQAIMMPTGAAGTELLAGREEIDFERIQPRSQRELSVGLFNGGTTDLTIEDVEVDERSFGLIPDFQTPVTLRIGEFVNLYVRFIPTEEIEYSGDITFTTNDEDPPVIHLIGVGDAQSGIAGDEIIPEEYSLGSAYPNPFNPSTTIPFTLEQTGDVELNVYDLAGRLVTTIASGSFSAGQHVALFNGEGSAAGVYLYKIKAGEFTAVRKMVLVK